MKVYLFLQYSIQVIKVKVKNPTRHKRTKHTITRPLSQYMNMQLPKPSNRKLYSETIFGVDAESVDFAEI